MFGLFQRFNRYLHGISPCCYFLTHTTFLDRSQWILLMFPRKVWPTLSQEKVIGVWNYGKSDAFRVHLTPKSRQLSWNGWIFHEILQCYGDTKKQCLIARGIWKTVRPDQNPVNLLLDSFGSLQRQIQSPGSIRPESHNLLVDSFVLGSIQKHR